MTEGDLVVVTGKLDTRVREKLAGELVIGTLWYVDHQQIAHVILADYDLWHGPVREIFLAEGQI